MNDDQLFLASAYLDGELTDDERRLAEGDPEVMAQVAEFRALRDEIADVPRASEAAREAAIAAAMSEFRRSTAPSSGPATSSAPIPFRPRPVYARYVGVAAALLAVVGLGVVIAQLPGDDDDSVATDVALEADEATADDGDARLGEQAESAADDAGGDAGAADVADDADDAAGGADEPAELSPATADADDGAGEDVEVAENVAEDTGEATFDTQGDAPVAESVPTRALRDVVVPPDFDPEAPLVDPEALVLLGAHLIEQRDAGQLPPTPLTDCETPNVLSRATIRVDDELVDALIAVDEVTDTVVAIDDDSCQELLVASP